MDVRGIHHLGLAVADLAAAVAWYQDVLGATVEGRERVEEQGVDAVALRLADGSRLELMAATEPDTPVGRFLARRGPGMHHVAYAVPDVAAALDDLAGHGATLIDTRPRHGLYGAVAFVHHESFFGTLTELVEVP